MQNQQQQAIREALAALAATHAIVVDQMDQMIALLTKALESTGADRLGQAPGSDVMGLPRADRHTHAVTWQDRSCFLGNTLLFRFFERLARTPNQYVSHVDLLDDVWDGTRDAASIRGVAKRLRDRLRHHGLFDLAKAIDGSVAGHYGLILV